MTSYRTRRNFLRAMGFAGVGLTLARFARAADGAAVRTNIVLVTVDDLGWTDVGCYGGRVYDTPWIDRLAAEGLRFTDAYSAAAVCSPSRAAILTGRYPARLGITDWIRARYQGGVTPEDGRNPSGYERDAERALETPVNALWLELDEVTIAEALRERGYATAHIGKWHLGAEPWYPERQGFDVNLGGCDLGEPPSFFDPYTRPANPNWKEPALEGIPTLPARREGEYLTDREADEAVAFIRTHRDRPFFLNLSHYAVHTPLQAPADLVEKYRSRSGEEAPKKPVYAAMIESVDRALGRVMETLDELGLAGRTMVVFTSDNGALNWTTNLAPLRGSKGNPFEGGLRVPLVVRWPGVTSPGGIDSTPVCGIDLFPTLCAVAGAPLPDERPIDGRNLAPLLAGAEDLNREALFWHFPHFRGRQAPFSAVRSGDWKLIRFYEGPPFLLFNLAEDLGERNDRSGEEPERVKQLDALLSDWLRETGARLPRPAPAREADARPSERL
jgi:arylsulfatase A